MLYWLLPSMQECYRAGLLWLAHSGIQAESGGVSRYFAGDQGQYRNISTEITGYATQAYLQLPLPAQTGLLSNALRAAQFLCYDTGDPGDGLFPFEISRDGSQLSDQVYFFDCGIVLRGLLALWNITGDSQYLTRAERCGAAMIQQMSRVDGAFFPLLDRTSGIPSAGEGHWSQEPGVYQLKTGLAFLELAELTSSGMFSRTAEGLLQWSMRQHEAFLPGADDSADVADRIHAYCYFLEGLLPFIDRRFDCVHALQGGITLVEKMVESHRETLERTDTIAQVLRVRLIAEYVGVVEIDLSAAAREAEALPGFQLQTTDRRTNGAFSFGRRNGELAPHANPVSTIFALQALRMWHEYQNGELRTTWRELI